MFDQVSVQRKMTGSNIFRPGSTTMPNQTPLEHSWPSTIPETINKHKNTIYMNDMDKLYYKLLQSMPMAP